MNDVERYTAGFHKSLKSKCLLREDDSSSSVEDSALVLAPMETSFVEAESKRQFMSP